MSRAFKIIEEEATRKTIINAIRYASKNANEGLGYFGRCGVFAVALHRVFPGGHYIVLRHRSARRFGNYDNVLHVAYNIGGVYYDEEHGGITNPNTWDYWGAESAQLETMSPNENVNNYLMTHTRPDVSADHIEKLLRTYLTRRKI
jgi:hypothetical protein